MSESTSPARVVTTRRIIHHKEKHHHKLIILLIIILILTFLIFVYPQTKYFTGSNFLTKACLDVAKWAGDLLVPTIIQTGFTKVATAINTYT
jgi:hypothetical protein